MPLRATWCAMRWISVSMHACRQNFPKALIAIGANDDRAQRGHREQYQLLQECWQVTPEGGFSLEDAISAPGKYVELRAEMDLLVLISNCPQLNNSCNEHNPTPIEILIWNGRSN